MRIIRLKRTRLRLWVLYEDGTEEDYRVCCDNSCHGLNLDDALLCRGFELRGLEYAVLMSRKPPMQFPRPFTLEFSCMGHTRAERWLDALFVRLHQRLEPLIEPTEASAALLMEAIAHAKG